MWGVWASNHSVAPPPSENGRCQRLRLGVKASKFCTLLLSCSFSLEYHLHIFCPAFRTLLRTRILTWGEGK